MPLNRFPSLPSIETVAVESSAIRDVTYDRQRETLVLSFRDSSIHQYATVPLHVYEALLRADSKGAYFNLYIRNHFPQRTVTRPEGLG